VNNRQHLTLSSAQSPYETNQGNHGQIVAALDDLKKQSNVLKHSVRAGWRPVIAGLHRDGRE
jgi:hypothetical protein